MLRFIFIVFLFLSMPALAYDKPYIGEEITYRAKYEDTFVHLARDYNLGFVEMRAANPTVDPWLPGKGTKIILPGRHLLPRMPDGADPEGVVINLPEMRLYAFVNGDAAPSTFPIGIGREGLNTPLGKTTVTRKKEGPTWTPTARMRKEDPELEPFYPPGPDNPLGTHALYLGWPTYAIHGTNRPFGIGRRISSGCIRMYPENIIRLYDMIPVGTKVTVVDQPIKLAWIDDRLYLEAHPELEQAIQMEEYGQVAAPKLSNDDLKRIVDFAGEHEDRLRWPAIRMAIKERKGIPVEIGRRPSTRVDTPDDKTDILSSDDVPQNDEAEDRLDDVIERLGEDLIEDPQDDVKTAEIQADITPEDMNDEKPNRNAFGNLNP